MRIVMLVLVGCAGAEDPQDPGDSANREPEDTEDPGESSGLVWVDADGEVVEAIVMLSSEPAYVDEKGVIWVVDPWEDGPLPQEGAEVVYSDPDCTEPWLPVAYYLSRQAVLVEDRILVVPDDRTTETLDLGYRESGGDCYEEGSGYLGLLPLDAFREVPEPGVTWAAPLHPELR